MYEEVKMEEGWRRCRNDVVDNLRKKVTFIKTQKIRWLEYVERMDNQRITQMKLYRKPVSRKRNGRPRNSWLDSVKEEQQKMDMKISKNKKKLRGS